MISQKNKICIVMWFDSAVAKKYGKLSYAINKAYCKKYGYDFKFSSKKRHNRKDLAWEKLPMVIEHLNNYDYVIWIDADAHFYIDRGPIEDLINQYHNKEIIFSEDGTCKGFPLETDSNYPAINTGVFIVKNTPNVKEILNFWTYDRWMFKQNYSNWEQGVCQKMYELNTYNIRDISCIVPYNIIQNYQKVTKHNPYVRHFPCDLKALLGIKRAFRGYLKALECS